MFPDGTPQVVPPAGKWVCSKCGCEDQAKVRPDPGRPSVDSRYAIGWCDECSPARRGVKGLARERVPLVHAGYWKRQAFVAKKQAEDDLKLLGRYRRGHALTADELARVRDLIHRQDNRP